MAPKISSALPSSRRALLFGGAASLLAGVTSPAFAAELPDITVLPVGSQFKASGISPTFRLGVASTFSVRADFVDGGAGKLTLERSADGGMSWAPFVRGSKAISVLTKTGHISVVEPSTSALYRLNATVTAGTIAYMVFNQDYRRDTWVHFDSIAKPGGNSVEWADVPGGFAFQVSISASDASVTITRSTDNGATWAALQPARTISTPDFDVAIAPGAVPARYRMQCTMTAKGSVDLIIRQGAERDFALMGPNIAVEGDARTQQRNALLWTPVVDADITGDLTLYKTCLGGTFAKITVPAAAQRKRGPNYLIGGSRDIVAEYVDVVSVFDGNGNALQSAKSYFDPGTTYQAGARITSHDTSGLWSGDFMCSRNPVGIYGFLTLLEAATYTACIPAPNFTALGL